MPPSPFFLSVYPILEKKARESFLPPADLARARANITLAAKYSVSKDMIFRIVQEAKADGAFQKMQDDIKKEADEEATLSMMEYIQSKRTKAQSLIDALLDIPVDLIKKSSLRDRMGAIKILTDCITDNGKTESADNRMQFTFRVMDLSEENKENGDAG